MKFALTIETGNAGMTEDTEAAVSDALRRVAGLVALGRTSAPILDYNGNTVGSWHLEAEEVDADTDE